MTKAELQADIAAIPGFVAEVKDDKIEEYDNGAQLRRFKIEIVDAVGDSLIVPVFYHHDTLNDIASYFGPKPVFKQVNSPQSVANKIKQKLESEGKFSPATGYQNIDRFDFVFSKRVYDGDQIVVTYTIYGGEITTEKQWVYGETDSFEDVTRYRRNTILLRDTKVFSLAEYPDKKSLIPALIATVGKLAGPLNLTHQNA